jgi:hypothetical protein
LRSSGACARRAWFGRHKTDASIVLKILVPKQCGIVEIDHENDADMVVFELFSGAWLSIDRPEVAGHVTSANIGV